MNIIKVASFNITQQDLEYVIKMNTNQGFWCSITKDVENYIANSYFIEKEN